MQQRKRIYVNGRGFVDVAKTVIEKLVSSAPVQTLATTALRKSAEVAGNKIGEFAATKLADKLTRRPAAQNETAIKAIEDIEAKIKHDISGRGFKLIR